MWNFFPLLTCVSDLLTAIRRELEKLRKDLEEEKLLRSNLEVVLAIWGGWSLEVCRQCSATWCHRKVWTNLLSLFFIAVLNECFMRQSDVCRRFTVRLGAACFIWKMIFNNMSVGMWVQFSVARFCSLLEMHPSGCVPREINTLLL